MRPQRAQQQRSNAVVDSTDNGTGSCDLAVREGANGGDGAVSAGQKTKDVAVSALMKYQCEICNKVFPRFYSLRRHQIMHSGEILFLFVLFIYFL